jgi:hypothetical protein
MQDSFSIRNNIDRPQAGEEPGKPLALLWIFKVMNPIMKGLLRSPLRRLLSGTLMLVHGSLHLATAPQRFATGGLGSCASRDLWVRICKGDSVRGGEALQLPEDVPTAPFGSGKYPGGDLLPLPCKGVFLGTPPAQHACSLLLFEAMQLHKRKN